MPASKAKTLSVLWRSAQHVATKEHNQLVVVLATSGYGDIFANFLCSVAELDFHNLLVLTDSKALADLARNGGHNVYIPDQARDDYKIVSFADFGSLDYQKLMLFRTETVMTLLKLGFRILLSDIDTIWNSNPLAPESFLHNNYFDFDIAVTDDRGEVCGCYMYFNGTEASIDFWDTVLDGHRDIVTYAVSNNSGHLKQFHDSEQKILTNLLYKNEYKGSIRVRILSADLYPSGYSYFNDHRNLNKSIEPVIIHNNFLIGKNMKRHRFARYGLWRYDNSNFNITHPYCKTSVNKNSEWDAVFSEYYKDSRIPTITFVLPVHEAYQETNTVVVQVLMEGFNTSDSFAKLYIENDPPSVLGFKNLAVYQLQTTSNSLGSLTAIVGESNLEISVDYTRDSNLNFLVDRDYKASMLANDRVRQYTSIKKDVNDIFDICEQSFKDDKLCQKGPQSFLFNESNSLAGALKSMEGPMKVSDIDFVIKVLAYNRPSSLLRLLKSLVSADYFENNVDIEIIIDGPKNDDEREIVEYVVKVAQDFLWDHGEKR